MIYYFPNRPILVPPDPENPTDPSSDYLDSLEESGRYIAEQKWNGDNCLVYIHKDGTFRFWNRHKKILKYTATEEVIKELKLWPKDSVLNAELVHSKTKGVKNLLIIHCIMRWEGSYLHGKTWGYSRELLDDCINAGLNQYHVQISKTWQSGFFQLFQEADGSVIEGIILKDPEGMLKFSATAPGNKGIEVPWMLKVRKPSRRIGAF